MSICEELCVELTDHCNQACVHCSTSATQDTAKYTSLSLETVKSLLEWFAGQGGTLIELSGGELCSTQTCSLLLGWPRISVSKHASIPLAPRRLRTCLR